MGEVRPLELEEPMRKFTIVAVTAFGALGVLLTDLGTALHNLGATL